MTAWRSGMRPQLYAGTRSSRWSARSRRIGTAVHFADQEEPMADKAILTNPLKEMMKAGKVALGMNVRLARSGDIARIAKSSGHAFIFIAVQHAIFPLEPHAHIADACVRCCL